MSAQILTASSDEQIARLAMVEALRTNTDAVNRMARRSEMHDKKLDLITATLGRIDTRLSLLESNPLKSEVERNRRDIDGLDLRVEELEADRLRRQGALSLFDWLLKNWPAVVGFVALIIVLVSTGRIGS